MYHLSCLFYVIFQKAFTYKQYLLEPQLVTAKCSVYHNLKPRFSILSVNSTLNCGTYMNDSTVPPLHISTTYLTANNPASHLANKSAQSSHI